MGQEDARAFDPKFEEVMTRSPRDVQIYATRAVWISQKSDQEWLEDVFESRSAAASNGLVPVVSLLETAVRIDPLEDACWHNLAWAYKIQGDDAKAIQALQRAIALEPEDPIYRASLGIFEERSDRDSAAKSYGRFISLMPRSIESKFYLDLSERDHELALESVRLAIQELSQTASNPLVKARLARIQLSLGNVDHARELAVASLSELPNLGGAWETLSEADLKQARLEASVGERKKARYLLGQELRIVHGSIHWVDEFVSPHARRLPAQYREFPVITNDLMPSNLLSYLREPAREEDE
ncbi:tetratricopeptide repeat protein [Terriglobus sp. ADX1]|uniref:tetratricopeptide repeat protein n=1 Tax=Terriglobus sp. ADX1 TaxID=2794063 RepID=UPI002FE51C26